MKKNKQNILNLEKLRRISILITLLLGLGSLILSSCVREGLKPEEAYVKLYGGFKNQQAWDLAEISDGTKTTGYVVVGSSNSFSTSGLQQMYIVKTDEEGNIMQSEVIGDTISGSSSEAKSVIIDSRGNIVLLGNTLVGGKEKLMVVKMDLSNLSILQTLIINSADLQNSETAAQIIESKEKDGYIIVGTTTKVDELKEMSNYDPERDRTDVLLLKADSALSGITWERIHGYKGEDKGSSVHLMSSGYAVLADSDSLSSDTLDLNNVFLFLTSYRGIPTNNAVFGTKDNDRAQTFRELADGSFAVTAIRGGNKANLYSLSNELIENKSAAKDLRSIGEKVLSIDTTKQGANDYVLLGTQDQRFALIPPMGDISTPIFYGGVEENVAAKVISLQSGGFAFCGTVDFGGNTMMGLVRVDEKGELKP